MHDDIKLMIRNKYIYTVTLLLFFLRNIELPTVVEAEAEIKVTSESSGIGNGLPQSFLEIALRSK